MALAAFDCSEREPLDTLELLWKHPDIEMLERLNYSIEADIYEVARAALRWKRSRINSRSSVCAV